MSMFLKIDFLKTLWSCILCLKIIYFKEQFSIFHLPQLLLSSQDMFGFNILFSLALELWGKHPKLLSTLSEDFLFFIKVKKIY